MKGIFFPGYVEIAVSSSDTERAKWNAIDWRIGYEENGLVDLDMVQTQNKVINLRIKYLADPADDWQQPSTTLARGTGDCEDYAILKMAMLAAIGFPRNKMALVLGEIAAMPQNEAHAFLVVEIDGKRWVLDNKFDQLIEPQDYINFHPMKMLCDDGVFLYSKVFTISEKGPASGAGPVA